MGLEDKTAKLDKVLDFWKTTLDTKRKNMIVMSRLRVGRCSGAR